MDDSVDAGQEDATASGPVSGLVIIGASAGGIDAVLRVVAGLPADLPLPVIVAQHLDPNRISRLGDLLASRSNLPVTTAVGHETLRPGIVYVVPADRDVEVTDRYIDLHAGGSRSQPSVDRLMTTAAKAFGESLIGVVLTGTGTDGTAGAQVIKAYGGTVIVQNPATAEYAGMPSAVPPAAVDMVAEIDAIGPLLADLARGDHVRLHPEEGELEAFLMRVRDLTGLDFGSYKRPTIERRLRRRMVAVGAKNLRDYRRHMEGHPEEVQRLAGTFLIKVTRFFRDPELFNQLRDQVLPTLIEQARERGELRIWSAGCATGEEAYSLAILVRDLLGEDDPLQVRIFATDVAADAVDFARRGLYPDTALDGVPSEMKERHFTCLNGSCEVRKGIRNLIVFGEHDLSRRAPFPRIDLVLCRNVVIYFTPELQRRALQLFSFSLRDGGYLVLGKAETASPLPDYFRLEQPRLKVFRRVGAESPVPAGRILASQQVRHEDVRISRPALPGVVREAHVLDHARREEARQTARILETIGAGIITVEANYHIRSINLAARQLLNTHTAGIGEDIIHQVPANLSVPLRAAIDAAFQGETTRQLHRITGDVIEEGGRDVVLACTPYSEEASDSADPGPDAAVIEIVDVTSLAQERRDLEQDRDRFRDACDDLQERMRAAAAEVRQLRTAHHVTVIEHGRLRAENEQLLLASEEAQAALEEIETLNEEQQAASEELETLNEELQATVEELDTTNADLQARTVELEVLASTLEDKRRESETERSRLQAVLTSMGDAVVAVDASGEVALTNPAWQRLLGPPHELVPEDEMGRPLPEDIWSLCRLTEGEQFTLDFSSTGPDGERLWFEANAQPIPSQGNGYGGMMVVRDITDRSLRRLQERFLAIASHELRTPLTTLSGSLQLLSRRLGKVSADERLTLQVDRARDQVKRLETLVSELTDVARLRGGIFSVERTPVNLAGVVREGVAVAGDLGTGIQVRLDLPDTPVRVLADSQRIQQVLLNLINNAFRHAVDTAHIDVQLRQESGSAVIEVRDYGPGISEEALAKVFFPFYQAADEKLPGSGLGLGLFISREIVSAHGGAIEVHSVEGEGATVEVRLALLDEGEPAAATDRADLPNNGQDTHDAP